MKQFIYADNAATTKMSDIAVQAMLPYLQEIYANASSVHLLGQRSAAALFSARQQVAQVLNCAPKEVFFTSGGSESDNQALISAAALGKKQGKCHIVSTAMEHHAILHTLEALEAQGFTVTLLRPQADGIVTATQVAEAITDTTCLVSVMYANNETGAIQPIREIGALCRKRGVLFHTDAVQAAGHLTIDVQCDNIDMLSLSAHKFHGPKGIGLLFAKSNIQLTSLIRGGGQERGKRAGTENLPGIIGLAAALERCPEKYVHIWIRLHAGQLLVSRTGGTATDIGGTAEHPVANPQRRYPPDVLYLGDLGREYLDLLYDRYHSGGFQ